MRSDNKVIGILKGIIFLLIGFVLALLVVYVVVNRGREGSDKTEFIEYDEETGADQSDTSEVIANNDEGDDSSESIFGIGDDTDEENSSSDNASSNQDDGSNVDVTDNNSQNDDQTGSNSDQSASDPSVESILSKMSLHDKVCQMFIVTPESLTGVDQVTEAGDATKESYKQNPVGGLVYFSQNLESTDQTKKMLSNMQHYANEISGFPIFLAVDEEGGTVARCEEKLGATQLNDMYNYKSEGTGTAYNNAATIAGYLKDYGFNLDFAPVADTWSNPSNTVIGKRAYSDDFNEASILVASAVKGFKDSGVACTLKHFPGHGDTMEDSHTSSATTSKTIDQMQNEEFLAFKSGIAEGADMVMVGHITVTSEDSEPATVSKKIVTDVLRNSLGYNGVVVTDALNMGAVSNTYSSSELSVKCVDAGVDIMLMPTDFKSAVSGLESAVESGQISESRIDESVRRILKVKMSMGN
ncbi:MAG: glycoside hydrolase family 3 [Eubacterium sp.]|nr:glycoside hydrolase family 3 [Eubacterium sp.]